MCRRLLALAALVLVSLSSITTAESRQEREIAARSSVEYVDMGIRLVVVERDDANGRPLVPGNSQRMREVNRIDVGGIVKLYRDAEGRRGAHIVRKSNNPVVWFASQAQADLIVHDGPIPSELVQGSEGSGKTTVLAMWSAWRVVEHIGHERMGWITAPTGPRLKHVRREIQRYWRPSWYSYSARDLAYEFHAGPTVQLMSAVQRSGEAGSPFQGGNLAFCGSDEFQDHHSRDGDIMARGRSAPEDIGYKRLCTSTFKDSTDWRDFRETAEKAVITDEAGNVTGGKLWHLSLLYGLNSPFIPASHWHRMRAGLTKREYQRRVLAMDVGPERQLYYSWKRTIVDGDRKFPGNLRPLPAGAVDVTRRELSRYGNSIGILLGHDPGKRQHVTEFLKAYEFHGENRRDAQGRPQPPRVRWFVVDELTTPECTVEAHVAQVLARLRSKHRCNLLDPYTGMASANSQSALCRVDPHTNSGSLHPGRSVQTRWRQAGIQTMAAAYNDQQKPTPIKVEERVDLLNTLLCNVDDERCLYVLDTDAGPAAPELVKAFETMERNEQGDAEWERKDASDRSHWPSAVAFAVWIIEKPRLDAWRARAA